MHNLNLTNEMNKEIAVESVCFIFHFILVTFFFIEHLFICFISYYFSRLQLSRDRMKYDLVPGSTGKMVHICCLLDF